MATEPKAPEPQEPQAAAVVVEPQSQLHVLDSYLAALKSAFDGALANPAIGRTEMFKAIQTPIDNVAAVMRSAVERATPHEAQADQMEAMEAMLQRVIAQHPNLQAATSTPTSPVPVARQLQPGVPPQAVQGTPPVAPATTVKAGSVADLVNRSVVGANRAAALRGETNV